MYNVLGTVVPVRAAFEIQFDRFEYFLGLMFCAEQQNRKPEDIIAPTGTFLWRRAREPDFGEKFIAQARERGDEWPPFQAGIFDKNLPAFEYVVGLFDEYVDRERARKGVRMPRR